MPEKAKPREEIAQLIRLVVDGLSCLSLQDRVEAINSIREQIHSVSPFRNEPVDFVRWVKAESVEANDYNPNSVAPPEMELLRVSIENDGYTQPIVAWERDQRSYEVVDGFHRNRVGKEIDGIRERVHGYLPLAVINGERSEKGDRIASTIRHNRARGKHKVEAMSDIVVELKRRNWSDEKIAKQLGMDQDEILRLCQITGLAELFSDEEFSRAWDVEGEVREEDFAELTDDPSAFDDTVSARTVNTSDPNRVFHTYEKWECYRAGFYATHVVGKTKEQCEALYRDFLSDDVRFSEALDRVISEWKHSCEHYLTNAAMNRIAWLGQAAACYALGLPSVYRSGFYLMPEKDQTRANETALKALNRWMVANGRDEVPMDVAYSGRQSDIY